MIECQCWIKNPDTGGGWYCPVHGYVQPKQIEIIIDERDKVNVKPNKHG